MRGAPPGYLRCPEHGLLYAAGSKCDDCTIAFAPVAGEGALEEDSWLHSEHHACETSYVGPCRACAQARVVHDAGDEHPGQFEGRRGVWLVGGGRNHAGTVGP